MATVLCLGEVVVDWIRTTVGAASNHEDVFEKHLAGVPANVAVGLARQNVESAMIGRVGDDDLGHWAKAELEREKVDVSSLCVDADAGTRAVYVARTPDGERQALSTMLTNCADTRLAPTDLVSAHFERASALYFGSTALSASPVSDTVAKAIELAKQHNLLVVSDANIWPAMWRNDDECRAVIFSRLKDIDLLKVTADELEFLTGSKSILSVIALRQKYAVPMITVTLGEVGAFVCTATETAHVAPLAVEKIEAAGAGDGFIAAVMASILPHLDAGSNLRKQLMELPHAEMIRAVRRGNAAGAIVCSRLGALSAMPTAAEIDELIQNSNSAKAALVRE